MTEAFRDLLSLVPRCEIRIRGQQCTASGIHHLRVTKGDSNIEVDVCRAHVDRFTKHAKNNRAEVMLLRINSER